MAYVHSNCWTDASGGMAGSQYKYKTVGDDSRYCGWYADCRTARKTTITEGETIK